MYTNIFHFIVYQDFFSPIQFIFLQSVPHWGKEEYTIVDRFMISFRAELFEKINHKPIDFQCNFHIFSLFFLLKIYESYNGGFMIYFLIAHNIQNMFIFHGLLLFFNFLTVFKIIS